MPDTLDANGLTIKTKAELVAELIADMQAIYGTDINTDSDSPDGQQIDIIAQQGIDQRELLEAINAGFNVDEAEGTKLDALCALIGITRAGATFTYQNVEVEIDRALGLVGLDSDALVLEPTGIYTVKDDTSNLFYLLDSVTFTGSGTYSLNFRAAEIGVVEVTPNTITTPVTVIAGVVSVNNPDAVNSTGVDEETDFQLRNRFKASTGISATGNTESLQAALANLTDVTVAKVYENYTHETDSDGIPAHCIWAIVQGGDPDEIGQAIYAKRGMGCNMRGDEEVNVTKPDGGIFISKYDVPVNSDLYIRLKITGDYDSDYVKSSIVDNLFWSIGGDASSDIIYAYLKALSIADGVSWVITDVEVSDNGSDWDEVAEISGLTGRFVNGTARITLL